MKNNIMVSIIVPVYNSEEYLHKCVNSILKQTYINIQVILVDDGSTDKSPEICDYFTKIDNRVEVIHKKNEGVSVARNQGIKAAMGECILFVDSDDYIDAKMVSSLLLVYENEDSDLILCENYYFDDIDEQYIPFRNSPVKRNVDSEKFMEIVPSLHNTMHFQVLWNKLFKTNIIKKHDICFNKNISLGEDILFIVDYISFCKSFYLLAEPLYYYRNNPNSITKKYYENYYELQKYLYDKISFYLSNANSITQNRFNTMKIDMVITSLIYVLNNSPKKNLKNELSKIVKDTYLEKIDFNEKKFNIQQKFVFVSIKLNNVKALLIYLKLKLLIQNKLPLFYSIIRVNKIN